MRFNKKIRREKYKSRTRITKRFSNIKKCKKYRKYGRI